MVESLERSDEIKILLVDDDKDFLEQEKIFLSKENENIQSKTVLSSEKALKELKKHNYDCVVSDYQMPEMDGLELLRKIREERNNDIPFIMFTGKGREEIAMKALNLGANRYLQKGGDPKSQYAILTDAIIQEVDHHNTNKEKIKARKEWQRTFDALPDITALISPDHEIIRINKKGAEALGMKREDIIGKKCYEILHKQDTPIKECPSEKALESGQTDVGEVFEENGKYYIASASPLLDENDEVEAFAHSIKDITERMKAEKKTRQTNEKLKTIFESMEDAVIMTDFEGNIIEANEAAAKMAGFKDKERYMKHNVFEFVHPEDKEIAKEAVEKTFNEGETQESTEYRILTKNGELIHTKTNTSLIQDDSGEPLATVNIVRDITEQKKNEEELEKTKKQFKSIFEELGEPVFIVSPGPESSSDILDVNSAAIDLTGYTKEELVGMNMVEDLAYEGPFELSDEEVERKLRKGETVRFTGKMKDKEGNNHYISVTNTPINYNGESAVLSINRDITDQKKRKEELKRSHEEYRELIDGMNDTAWVLDFDGRILEVNASAVEKLGYPRDELLSMKLNNIDASLDLGKIMELIEDMREDEVQVFETVHETKYGEKIPVEISSSLITYHGEKAILSIARDISEQKKVVKRRDFLHSLLRHDVRNKIQLVLGYKELLEDMDLPEEAQKYVSKEKKGVESALEIIKKVNVLRKAEKELIKEIDICTLLHEHIEEWKSLAKEREMELKLNCPQENCKVKGGPLLKEIYSNIIENSVQHSKGNKIKIQSKKTEKEIICIIEDDGKGLSDEQKDKIFNKGFTTDEKRGTGLGMYLVKELIETYDGEILVKDSELGGARFDIHLQKA